MDRRRFLTAAALPIAASLAVSRRKGRKLVRTIDDRMGLVGRAYAVRVGSIASGQSPVALVAADGEYLTGNVQSNFAGDGFWTRNGFTRGRDWVGPKPGGGNFAGFDDPNFLLTCSWLTDYGGLSAATAYSRMNDLGLNGMFPASGAINLDDLATYGKWAIVTDDTHAAGTISSGQDPYVIGVSTGEEPSLVTQYNTIVGNALTWLSHASDGPGRIHGFNHADALLNGDIEGTYLPRDMAIGWRTADGGTRTRRVLLACDQYWYAGSGADDAGGSRSKLHFRLYTGASGSATTDQCARGCHYGSQVASMRKAYQASPNSGLTGPFVPWIEAAAPYTESTSQAMTPAMLKWAVWSTLTHGARAIGYFVHHFRTSDPHGGAFWDDYFGAPGVAGTGIYAAAKEVNLYALAIAPALNGPFDGHFVYGDTDTGGAIAQSGFVTAATSTNARSKYGGVDVSCRWNPLDSKHYILATTRESGSATNVPLTVRMVDQGQTQAVSMTGGSTLSISRGGAIPGGFCEFSHTFPTAADYAAWRVD